MGHVPFFKKHAWAARQGAGGGFNLLKLMAHRRDQRLPQRPLPHHRGHLPHHGQNLGHAALVEHRHLHTLADQQRGNISLQVGETKNAVGIEIKDFVNFCRQESAHARLLGPRLFGAHRVARDAHDAVRLAQQVKPFRCLLRQADDALRTGSGQRGVGAVVHQHDGWVGLSGLHCLGNFGRFWLFLLLRLIAQRHVRAAARLVVPGSGFIQPVRHVVHAGLH